jgi:hypothetical protein
VESALRQGAGDPDLRLIETLFWDGTGFPRLALHLARLADGLAVAGIAHVALALPAGEATKAWPHLARCTEWLLDRKVERRDVVIALGGGVPLMGEVLLTPLRLAVAQRVFGAFEDGVLLGHVPSPQFAGALTAGSGGVIQVDAVLASGARTESKSRSTCAHPRASAVTYAW